MSEDLKKVVKWLNQMFLSPSLLREEDVDIQAMRGLCDAQLARL
jgi:hypothetical protein